MDISIKKITTFVSHFYLLITQSYMFFFSKPFNYKRINSLIHILLLFIIFCSLNNCCINKIIKTKKEKYEFQNFLIIIIIIKKRKKKKKKKKNKKKNF